MNYELKRKFLIKKGIVTSKQYKDLKKTIPKDEEKTKVDLHIDRRFESPKLNYLESIQK